MVPMFTMHRSIGSTSSFSPAASPRLRRRHSPWPPDWPCQPMSELSTGSWADTHRCPAHIHQIGAGCNMKGVQPLVHSRYASRSCLADLSRLVVPTHPAVVRAACRPPQHLLGRAALSFNGLLRQSDGGVLSSPHGYMAPHGVRHGFPEQWPRRPVPACQGDPKDFDAGVYRDAVAWTKARTQLSEPAIADGLVEARGLGRGLRVKAIDAASTCNDVRGNSDDRSHGEPHPSYAGTLILVTTIAGCSRRRPHSHDRPRRRELTSPLVRPPADGRPMPRLLRLARRCAGRCGPGPKRRSRIRSGSRQ
jgi:hypothetical protein